jgi:hypothetical protein
MLQVAALGDVVLCKRLVEIQKFDVNERDAFGRFSPRALLFVFIALTRASESRCTGQRAAGTSTLLNTWCLRAAT